MDFSLFEDENFLNNNDFNIDEIKNESQNYKTESIIKVDSELLEKYKSYFFNKDNTRRDITLPIKNTNKNDTNPSLRSIAKEFNIKGHTQLKRNDLITNILNLYNYLPEKEEITQEQEQDEDLGQQVENLLNNVSFSKRELIEKIIKLDLFQMKKINLDYVKKLIDKDISSLNNILNKNQEETADVLNNSSELLFNFILSGGYFLEQSSDIIGLNFNGTVNMYKNDKQAIIQNLNKIIEENPQIQNYLTPQIQLLFLLFLKPAIKAVTTSNFQYQNPNTELT